MGSKKRRASLYFVKRFAFESIGGKIGLGIFGGSRSELKFVGDPDGIYVATVDQKSPAYSYILPQDQILSVNGETVFGKTHEQVVELFRNSSNKVELEIKRSVRSTTALLSFSKFSTFISFNNESGCGFEYKLTTWPSYSSPSIYHMVITSVKAYGPAYGSLITKDVILKLNNTEVVGLCIKEIDNIINSSNGSLNVVFMRKPNFLRTYTRPKDKLGNQVVITIDRDGDGLFGFGMIGGENKVPVFVASVDAFTPAEKSGLKPGDIILKVDGVDVSENTHEEITEIIRKSVSCELLVQRCFTVDFLLNRYIKKDFGRKANSTLYRSRSNSPETNNSQDELESVKSFYVRALSDFNPSLDKRLPAKSFYFQFGDIIHVTNGNDQDWWQAELVNCETEEAEERLGVIPSNYRLQNRLKKASRSVRFNIDYEENNAQKSTNVSNMDDLVVKKPKEEPFYKMITRKTVEFSHRPVIFMGDPTENVLYLLINSKSTKFCLPTRYTTKLKKRPKNHKQKEVDLDTLQKGASEGIFVGMRRHKDYYFAYKLEELVENCRNEVHTILDLTSVSVKTLEENDLHPLVLFMKPPDLEHIIERNKRISEDEAKKILQICTQLEKEYKTIITHKLNARITLSSLVNDINEIVEQSETKEIWVSAENKLF